MSSRHKPLLLKKKNIVLGMLILGVAVVILAFLNRPSVGGEPGTIRVTRNGTVIKTFSMEDIEALPVVEAEKSISSGKGEDEEGVFTGVSLQNVLNAADPTLLATCKQVITRADDGYVSIFTLGEVLEGDNILVVYAKDGEALKNAAAGGAGPFRIIVQGDAFGTRCTKYLNVLEVE